MSYRVNEIDSDDTAERMRQAQQVQQNRIQQTREGKIQEDGTKVEDSSALHAVSQKYDSIELSDAARQALSQAKSSAQDGAGSPPPAGAPKTQEASTDTSSLLSSLEEDSVSSGELYTMSEVELQSLVSSGTITRSEMASELARRNGGAVESGAVASLLEAE